MSSDKTTPRDREADIAAYREAARKANESLTKLSMTEDEFVEEFAAMRRAEYEAALKE